MASNSNTSQRSRSRMGAFFRRNWTRLLTIRERFRVQEETFHLMMAGVVGVVGGVVNMAFVSGLLWVQRLSLSDAGDLVEVAYGLAATDRLFIPAIGGMGAGLILYWGLQLVGPQGSNNILEVVVSGDGRLRIRTALVKAISSMLSISTGASIGREGSITQLTATLASKAGQVANWQPYRLRLLVACGAASGLAAAYNAPVAGAVFAAQIVLGNFSMNFFAPLVFSSVVASIVSRSFFGIEPAYRVPEFDFYSISQLNQLIWFLPLGVCAGILGAVFLKMLRYFEDLFDRLKWPIYDRLALGGILVGVLAIPFPEVWGNGYSVTNDILHQEFLDRSFPILALLGIFLAKLIATSITVGSGAVGGVFTPTLFLGASLGSLFGVAMHSLDWAEGLPVGSFALVGMGSVLSATVHSPLLAFIMIFEISLNYSLMPALMLACAVATLVARRLHTDSIYTEPLRRRGISVERESFEIGAAMQQTVGGIMRAPVPPLRETASFQQITDRFLTSPNNFLPVVDAQNRLLGIVALHDLKEYLNAGLELSGVIAYDLMRPPPHCLTPDQKLLDALQVLLSSELRNVPVVNNVSESRLVGSVRRAEALGLLSEAIAKRSAMSKG